MSNTSFPKEKIKILLLENVHPVTVKMLHDEGFTAVDVHKAAMSDSELMHVIDKYHVIGIRSKTHITRRHIEKAGKLMCIGAFCIGTNQIDLEAAMQQGITVFNSPFSNTRSVAEMVIGLSIMLMRKIPEKNAAAHLGQWLKESKGCYEVRGKTIGIIGYGRIGSQVSVMAESLGMQVLFYDVVPTLSLGNARRAKSIDELLGKSDMVTLHVPESSSTKNMVNESFIRKMKTGAVLINLARGTVVDLSSLKKALESKKLNGAALDVFPAEPESTADKFVSTLQGLPNVILTPHIGGSTMEAQENIGADVASKIISLIDTGSTTGSLTVPELSLPVQTHTHRILHIHRNVPGVLSQINTALSRLNVNILGQYLKTNEKIGYVVLDIDKKTSAHALAELKKVKETIKVRSLY